MGNGLMEQAECRAGDCSRFSETQPIAAVKPDKRFPLEVFQTLRTPFYYYDLQLLQETIDELRRQSEGLPCVVHYALKANGNPRILSVMAKRGLSADLVSGGELKAALAAGFAPKDMTFAGAGKTDWEIRLALEHSIGCFNVESVPELEAINQLAMEMEQVAHIAIRVNPEIDAHTHRYITTGTANDKFGIDLNDLPVVIAKATSMSHIHLRGLHFHIGSQITDMTSFVLLCDRINRLQDEYEQQGVRFELINVGGGLGVDYDAPDTNPIANFKDYFNVFKQHLRLRQGQQLHFELGRALMAQCGSLISRVTFVKRNSVKAFVILDAGMNDLVRPALYGAHHQVQNLTSMMEEEETYDVVGPICESSDVFAHDCPLPVTQRGDLVAIRSAGAYGESMASTYNMRPLPQSFFSPC